MKTTVKGAELVVSFKHINNKPFSNPEKEQKRKQELSKGAVPGTTCIIKLLDNDKKSKIIAIGKTQISHRDNMNKSIGRKLALKRALFAVFNKEERTEFYKNLGI